MADPEDDSDKDAPSTREDALALGIGCLVFVIMFVAVIMVGMTRE